MVFSLSLFVCRSQRSLVIGEFFLHRLGVGCYYSVRGLALYYGHFVHSDSSCMDFCVCIISSVWYKSTTLVLQHHLRNHVFHLCMVRCMSETENCKTSKEYEMMGMDLAEDNNQ